MLLKRQKSIYIYIIIELLTVLTLFDSFIEFEGSTYLTVNFHYCFGLTHSLISFCGIPILSIASNNLSIFILSKACLKSIKSIYKSNPCSLCFSIICLSIKIWSIVLLFRQNPHWCSPIIFSVMIFSLSFRMLENILYVLFKSVMPL